MIDLILNLYADDTFRFPLWDLLNLMNVDIHLILLLRLAGCIYFEDHMFVC
jgi:hypothetical protein